MMHEKLPELLADVNREKKHQMGTLIEEAGLLNWAVYRQTAAENRCF